MHSLRADGISMRFGALEALANIDIEIGQGKVTAIVGSSGSGKSTLLKILAGKLSASEGHISIDDLVMPRPSEMLVPGYERVSLQEQDFQLPPRFTVFQNVKYPLRRYNHEYQLEVVNDLLSLVGMREFADRECNLLSGGQKQRVALARALAGEPSFLLLDEPFNQLDFSAKSSLKNVLRQIVLERNVAIVVTSHEPSDILSFADRVVVLKRGIKLTECSPSQLYKFPKSLYVAKLFGIINEISSKDLAMRFGIHKADGVYLFRPEYIRLDERGYNMKVIEISHMGHFYCTMLSMDDLTLYMIVPPWQLPKVGSLIKINIDNDYLSLVEATNVNIEGPM